MAGHSQFKNIMYRKGAQDAKRAKIFTKIGRELTVAAKAGAGAVRVRAACGAAAAPRARFARARAPCSR